MKKSTTNEINANYLANLFEEKDNEILEKEKATTKRKAKKATVEKAEITEKTEKPKTVKKATKTVEQAKELRKLDSLKIAKVTYERVDNINSYGELSKAIEKGDDVYVAFDISSVKPSEYENIFHVPFSEDMKDNFDICQPIFICDKNPRLIFASLYTEALWDLFPDEFDLLSAVLIEKPNKKAKK